MRLLTPCDGCDKTDALVALVATALIRRAAFLQRYVSAIDSQGRTIWIADAHREDGKHFVVRADEKLTAFMELVAAISGCHERLRTTNRTRQVIGKTLLGSVVRSWFTSS